MFRFLLAAVVALSSPSPSLSARPGVAKHFLRFAISTTWDGKPLSHDRGPAEVLISADHASGGLRVTVDAPFFNSPALTKEQLTSNGVCPEHPILHLGESETVEVYFLNEEERYFQIVFSPDGGHLIFLHNAYRKKGLISPPLRGAGTELHNPCIQSWEDFQIEEGCRKRWLATAVIPREYLPANITKFNAYTIHGQNWGQLPLAEEDATYEALYPVDTEATGRNAPDFHYLPAFKSINLANIGYEGQRSYSSLWKNVINDGDHYLTQEIVRTADCREDIPSDGYETHISTRRSVSKRTFTVTVDVKENDATLPEEVLHSKPGPDSELSVDEESVWLSVTTEDDESLRLGINPMGAYDVKMFNANGELGQGFKLEEVQCSLGYEASWNCQFTVPWDLLPPALSNFTFFQAIHFHRLASELDGSPSRLDFVGATCPGFDPEADIDWKGCSSDVRLIWEPSSGEYSEEWERALSGRGLGQEPSAQK